MRFNRTISCIILIGLMALVFSTPVVSTEDWFEQGVDHLTANRLDNAIEAFTRSIEMIPHDYEAYNNRGIAYSRKGISSLAELDFTKALELNPEFYDPLINRGITRQQQGAYAHALLDYLAAYQLRPESQRPQLLVVWLLASCPDTRLRNGALALNIVQQLAGNRPSEKLFPFLAAAYAEIGDFENAVPLQEKYLEFIQTTQPDSPQVVQHQSHLKHYRSGRPLQISPPPSQKLSNSACMNVMDQVNSSFKKSLLAATSQTKLAKKKQAPVKSKPTKRIAA